MDYVENPRLGDLRREFLDEVASIHEKHNYTDDWDHLAATLGVNVRDGDRSHYVSKGGSNYIFLDRSEWGVRRNYSFAHEISHHLFCATDSAFQAVLQDALQGAPDEVLREHEEALCHDAAALLIFPRPFLLTAIQQHGLSPEAVIRLSTERGGSLSAAIIRVVGSFETDLWGYVVNRRHVVEFAWTRSKYRPGRGTVLDHHHPMRAAWAEGIETRARLPLKGPRTNWRMTMRAAARGNQLVALFADPFPILPNEEQPSLFASDSWAHIPAAD